MHFIYLASSIKWRLHLRDTFVYDQLHIKVSENGTGFWWKFTKVYVHDMCISVGNKGTV